MGIINLFQTRSDPEDRFGVLVRPHIEGLYRFAYRLCSSGDGAEELVQSLLSRIYPKLEQLESIENRKSWLARSLYNLYIDTYRRQVRESNLFIHDASYEDIASETKSPYAQTNQNEQNQQLTLALQQLNHDQRTVVMLHDAEGYTLPELETILQTPLGTLKSRLHRARNQLKDLLTKEPYEDPERLEGMKEKIS